MDGAGGRRSSVRRGRWIALVAVAALCGLAWLLRAKVPRTRDVALAPATQLEPAEPDVTLATELVEGPVSAERSDASAEVEHTPEKKRTIDALRVRVTDRAGQPLAGARVGGVVLEHTADGHSLAHTLTRTRSCCTCAPNG